MEHAGSFWTERVKTVLDGTNSAHLISELATLKATLALPGVNLALPMANKNSDLAPTRSMRSDRLLPSKGAQGDRGVQLK